MTLVAVTQRVVNVQEYEERRDALDQRWSDFLFACDCKPLLLPNRVELALQMVSSFPVQGLLLTGGNNLVSLGGDAPERDQTEHKLIDYFVEAHLPVLGICRGMQLIQERAGINLEKVARHVAVEHLVSTNEGPSLVNSYHNFGTTVSTEELLVDARAEDGVVESVRHHNLALFGIMWHPERVTPFAERDIQFFKNVFGGNS